MTAATRILLILLFATGPACAEVIHHERSVYRDLLVVDEDGRRCMQFGPQPAVRQNQSCRFLDGSRRLALEYTRIILAGLLLIPEPRDILIVGLGGGTLPMAFADLLPSARITSVEVDPAVVRVARQFFGYQDSERVHTVIEDGRVHIKRLGRAHRRHDLIVLDAFTGDYIPEHLMTREFLQEVSAVLASRGVVIANTFRDSRLYHHESVTYESVFARLLVLQSTRLNRVLFAAHHQVEFPRAGAELLRQLQARLSAHGVDLAAVLRMQQLPDWDRSARILTDSYVPANLLRR